MSDPLYPHQELALRKLSNGKVLWGGTGSGKTRVAVEYYMLKERPRHVYVITTARKRDSFDWQDDFYKAGIGPATGPTVDLRRGGVAVQQRTDLSELREVSGGNDSGAERNVLVGARGVEGRNSRDDSSTRRNSLGEAGAYPYVLTVDSWNNIAKYADVAGTFFIFDEQRLVGSGNWVRKFLRIAKHNRWILLSATPGDTWMDYVPLFVANDFYKNRTEFKREHVVYNTFTKFPKIDRYINQGKLARLRSQVLVEMPVERHTKRHHVEVMLEYDKVLLDRVLKDRWHVYEDRPLNDVGEMFLVARKVVNSDPSRLEMVKELWKNHPRLIVFYNFNYELESLRSLAGSSTTTDFYRSNVNAGDSNRSISNFSNISTTSLAEWNGHKHQPVPTTDQWIYLVQYQAGAEAWNCIETDAMILYSQNYSWKIMEQAYGRIDRINTLFRDLWYYGFTTNSFIDQAIARSLRAKETFNEAKYAKMFKG